MNRDSKSLREIVGKYSPIIQGRTGWKGAALHAVTAPFAAVNTLFQKLIRLPFPQGYENEAGQSLTDCGPEVPTTFRRMEKKLKTAFMAAALPASTLHVRKQFLDAAVEIRRDAHDLSQHCTIRRSELDFVTEPYKFVLAKTPEQMTLLADGVAAIKATLEPEKKKDSVFDFPLEVRRAPRPSSLAV